MQYRRFISVLVLSSFLPGVGLIGCGKYKSASDPYVTVTADEATAQESKSAQVKSAFDALYRFYELYGTESGGFTREGLMNLLENFRPILDRQGEGTADEAKKIVDLLFNEITRSGKPGRQSIENLVSSIENIIPVLRWIHADGGILPGELKETLNKEFPNAHPSTLNAITRNLMVNDLKAYGGNENGRLERKEVTTTGVLFSVLLSIDPSKIKEAANKTDDIRIQLLMRAIYNKLDKQIILRHPNRRFKQLSIDDQKLEIMVMATKYLQIDRLMDQNGGIVPPTPANFRPIFKELGHESVLGFRRTIRFYLRMGLNPADTPASGSLPPLNSIRLFNLITDLEYVQNLRVSTRFQSIQSSERFSLMEELDKKSEGGNENKRVDDGEMVLGLALLELEDLLFQQFDNNTDQTLSFTELESMLSFLNYTDQLAAIAFMGDIGLSSSRPSVFDMIRLFLYSSRSNIKDKESLTREEFHERIWKILKRRFN